MFYVIKRLGTIIKSVSVDTHLWCLGVIGGAALLCVSFFAQPSAGRLVTLAEDTKSLAQKKVIEYSSVLGSLSGIDSLEEEEVVEIVQAIPEHIDTFIGGDIYSVSSVGMDPDYTADTTESVATGNAMVDISNVYSAEDVDALERLVQCEASTEDSDGKALVASVVLNRVETGIWGDDILSVIEASGQFQPVESGAYSVAVVDSDTKEAVIEALIDGDISHGALYFQKSTAKIWGDKEFLFRHGSHSFYR